MNLKSDIRIKILNDIGPRPIEKYVFKKKNKKQTNKQQTTKQKQNNKIKNKKVSDKISD